MKNWFMSLFSKKKEKEKFTVTKSRIVSLGNKGNGASFSTNTPKHRENSNDAFILGMDDYNRAAYQSNDDSHNSSSGFSGGFGGGDFGGGGAGSSWDDSSSDSGSDSSSDD